MIHEVLSVKVDYSRAGLPSDQAPKLYTYVISHSPEMDYHKKRPAVVICPGGGYGATSDREAEPIALKFVSMGFQCFVLRYTVQTLRFPGALLELAAAVSMVRENAEKWDVDPDKIMVAGFSAGGHLACSLGMFWNRNFVADTLGFHNGEHKPNGMILAYPVITSGEFAHRGSFENLLLDTYDENLELVSLENQVSADTPPAFIWHTFDDNAVPVENALLLATAMRKQQIPFELHIFPRGVHGLSLATSETGVVEKGVEIWTDCAAKWVNSL